MKFEADYRHTQQTHSFSFLTQRTYSCNIFIGVRIIKEMPGSVASGTHCIIYNKPTRCISGSIVFIKNYKYALHVSVALCLHLQEHYKL